MQFNVLSKEDLAYISSFQQGKSLYTSSRYYSWFYRYPYLGIFVTGYPCDHYFGARAVKAQELRAAYPGKFIVSFHDNIMAQDLAYSPKMQTALYEMFLRLLERYDNLSIPSTRF